MKTVVGNVLQVDIDTNVKKKDGGTYKGWRLTYRTEDGTIEEIAKHMNTLKYQPSLRPVLESLAKDDEFTIELEKGDSGYWEVVSIAKGANMPAPTPKQAGPKYKTDRMDRSDDVQKMIVRQNVLGHATAALAAGSKAALKPEDVIAVAEKYEAWVMSKNPAPEVE